MASCLGAATEQEMLGNSSSPGLQDGSLLGKVSTRLSQQHCGFGYNIQGSLYPQPLGQEPAACSETRLQRSPSPS